VRDSFVGNKGGERKRVECEIVYVAENLPDSRAGDFLRDVKQWQKREFLVDLSRDTIRGLVTTATAGVRRRARLVANGKNYRTQTNTKKEMVMTTLKKCLAWIRRIWNGNTVKIANRSAFYHFKARCNSITS
jgi:hypothetical protein